MQLLLNVGGPDRVSRVEMAEAVARIRGYDASLIRPVSASSVCFKTPLLIYSFVSVKSHLVFSYYHLLSVCYHVLFPIV